MVQKILRAFILLSMMSVKAQTSSTDPIYEAKLVSGKEDLEQIIQTQFTLPKSLLTAGFEKQITCYFNLDPAGKPVKIKFEQTPNNLLRLELLRLFNFYTFRHTLNLPNEERPYFLQFDVSTEKYNRYIKQKFKNNLKKPLPADSSYVIYTRADLPPVYYKNGEEGLNELILEELEYPKVAKDRSIQGTVILEFIVETNGYITGITVKQGVNGGCTEEAIRIMKNTRWVPATENGKFVRYRTSYPITFNIMHERNSGGAVNGMGN